MKTVPFEKLYTVDIAMTEPAVIYQTPQWNSIEMKSEGGRRLNGFLLIDRGECSYEWQGGSADLSPGSLIYLPTGSRHTVTVTSRPFSFYRICFTLIDPHDGEGIVFSEGPQVMTCNSSGRLLSLAREMVTTTVSRAGIFKSTALMSEFFHVTAGHSPHRSDSRIAAAVEYIDANYTKNTSVEELANLCYISKPHLFRLFRREIGISPLEYRNSLRIRRAKELLSDGECTVSEIASMLGFESGYYFSRVFKACTGMAPTRYAAAALTPSD